MLRLSGVRERLAQGCCLPLLPVVLCDDFGGARGLVSRMCMRVIVDPHSAHMQSGAIKQTSLPFTSINRRYRARYNE